MAEIQMSREPQEAEYTVNVNQRELDFIVWSLGERSPHEAEQFELEEREFNELHDTLLDRAGQLVPVIRKEVDEE